MSATSHKILLMIIALLTGAGGYSQLVDTSFAGFRKQTLSNEFISEGVAVGDVNKDGKIDVLAGSFWFEAPDWKQHALAEGKKYEPKTAYSRSFINHCMDVDRDGWMDMIVVDFPGTSASWFRNPANGKGYWTKHLIYETVGNESPAFADVDGDGREDLICADSKERKMVCLQSPAVKGGTEWKKFAISGRNPSGTDIFSHGLGFGDLNRDGKKDVLVKNGWWESPADPRQPDWKFHPADLGEDCSQMYVLDVNGDGRSDVISASAHKYGIWWHEQYIDEDGQPAWGHHTISYSSSQTHAVAMADFNSDGNPDFVTGKRYFAHLEHTNPGNRSTIDPGTYEQPAIYWFEFTPGKKPYWIEHRIDDDSGVGINVVAQDITNDGRADIVVANKKGVFVFENVMKKK